MAGAQLKLEQLDVEPAFDQPEKSPSPSALFVAYEARKPSPAVPSKPACTTLVVGNHRFGQPTWRDCSNYDMATQVAIKEKAVRQGMECLKDLGICVRRVVDDIPSAITKCDKIRTVWEAKKDCRVLIGFIGTTGAGKSSLINALLGEDDLLPADDEKACTAVCVEIKWNTINHPDEAYRATIDRISVEDWRTELDHLFTDISDQAQNKDGEDGEPDLERSMRIKTAFHKIQCVYPHIKSPHDLVRISVQDLLDHANVKSTLGTQKMIKCATREEFAQKIRRYIDSSSSSEPGTKLFAQWPLVKLVQLSIKASILENGLVLVDLPGTGDTNAARGAVAEDYQKNLYMTCVVAPTARAASDRPAQELLGKYRQQMLQLDNRFSSRQLCFVVTKTDSSLVMDRYIQQHENIHALIEVETKKLEECDSDLARLREFCAEMHQNESEYSQRFKEATADSRKRTIQVNKLYPRGKGKNKKRKYGSDDAPSDPGLETSPEEVSMRTEIQALHDERANLNKNSAKDNKRLVKAMNKAHLVRKTREDVVSRQMSICIKNRNSISISEITRDFNETAKQQELPTNSSSSPLRVHCISSWAFSALRKGKSFHGFSSLAETGIPNLQDWLQQSTLDTRNRNALIILENIVSLELSLAPWVADISTEFKIHEQLRSKMDEVFDTNYEELRKKLNRSNKIIVVNCQRLIDDGVLSKMIKAENTAANEAEGVVRRWAQKPITWGTHRATNKRMGEWTTGKGIENKWNEDLASLYLQPLVAQWSRTINRLPALREGYNSNFQIQISRFLDIVMGAVAKANPDVVEAFSHWKESTERTLGPIKNNSLSVFETTIQEASNSAHRMVKLKVLEVWTPIYLECGAAFGPGHYKRNQHTHNEHVKKTGRPMYRKCSNAVKSSFTKLWHGLPAEFVKGTEIALAQIREEFELVLDNHMVKENKEYNDQKEVDAKKQLQKDFSFCFGRLAEGWAEVPEVVMVPEETETEVEMIDIESVFGENLDDDDDLFDEFE